MGLSPAWLIFRVNSTWRYRPSGTSMSAPFGASTYAPVLRPLVESALRARAVTDDPDGSWLVQDTLPQFVPATLLSWMTVQLPRPTTAPNRTPPVMSL